MTARIRGDWGSSNLRLWLVEGGTIVARAEGPGIVGLGGGEAAAAALRKALDALPARADRIALCGMAGARGGLHEAGYVDCPVSVAAWRTAATGFGFAGMALRIAPGVADQSACETMRGEESQIFGAIARARELGVGRRLFLLPGTHSKWAWVADGRIMRLRTFLTGEVHAALLRSSLVAGDGEGEGAGAGFAEGLAAAPPGGALLGTLFQTRSRQLLRGRSPGWARGFLSGLLIGSEIAEIVAGEALPDTLTVIGGAALTARYAMALAAHGIAADAHDGDACAIAGLELLDADA